MRRKAVRSCFVGNEKSGSLGSRRILKIFRVLSVIYAASISATAIPIELIVHESTEFFFDSGGTFVGNCLGLGCVNASFEVGPISGSVLWRLEEKVLHNESSQTSTFLYTLFNETLTLAITDFQIANAGLQGSAQVPLDWSFNQSSTVWHWQAQAPEFGISAPFFLEFGIELAGLVPVGFNPTSIALADESMVASNTWVGSAPLPEPPAGLLVAGSAFVLYLIRRVGRAKSALLTIACLVLLATQGLNAQQPIRILYPPNGAVISSQNDTRIIAELAPQFQDPDNFNFLEFTAIRTDSTAVFPLGRGDLRSLRNPNQASVLWSTTVAPSGEYIVVAAVQNKLGILFTDAVRVTVNRAPSLSIRVLSQRSQTGGIEITFEAVVKDTEDDPITRILWTPGDSSPMTDLTGLTPFTHFYGGKAGETVSYILSVTAEDARGGQTTVQRDVAVAEDTALAQQTTGVVQQTHDCGCEKMDIFSMAFNSFTYCGDVPTAAVYPGCVAAPDPTCAGGKAFQCALGPYTPGQRGSNDLGWSFEINAHLDPRTNAIGRCSQGQAARTTVMIGGKPIPGGNPPALRKPPAGPNLPFPNPPAGALVNGPNPIPPVGGANWGADGYTNTTDPAAKRHLEALGRIRWLDAPALTTDAAMAALDDHKIFVAWVTGNLGTCWCQFEVKHSWTAAGGRVGPPVITRLDGKNCDP
jgi:hypothetical protein